ncbi:MAG TPA: ABC transporter permease [Thermoanaerobaculia bacterium]|nr:ABC transporter permease [Thermoanaerobaculia bacterium]
MSQITQDLGFAARNLRKQPALAFAAILTLALGIGVNAAIFSIVNAVLLAPPPFREPERVALVWADNPEVAKSIGMANELASSVAHLADWSKAPSIEYLGSFQANRMALTGEGFPELLGVVKVTGDFFNALGAEPQLGRTLQPEDDPPGLGSTVVLSHSLWQRKFESNPGILGKPITLSGNPYTVVGVMPRRFTFPRGGQDVQPGFGFAAEPDIWIPMEFSAQARQDRTNRGNVGVARLRKGASIETAQAELDTISQRLAQSYPETETGWKARLQPIMEKVIGDLRPALLILWASVGLVLLIACANVTNLLLARAASRQKEIAVRMAMGAGRKRLLSQLLTESFLLAVLGGAVGLFLGWIVLRLFERYIPTGLIGSAPMTIDGSTIAFTALLCLLTTALAGLVPALQMSRPNLAGTLREGTRAGSGTAGSRRTRSALVVAEIAVAVLLLIGAGLLLRSFFRLLSVDPGFKPQQILTAEMALTADRVPFEERGPFILRVFEKIKTVPGVQAAALISDLPMGVGETLNNVAPEGYEFKEGEVLFSALRTVTPGYFEVMGVPLLGGRYFTDADREDSSPVIVINEVMAKELWPGQDPVGKRLFFGLGGQKYYTIVGVVGGIRYAGLQGELRSEFYRLVAQAPPGSMPFIMRAVMRAEGDPMALANAVRTAVKEVDPGQPVSSIQTMETLVSKSVAKPRFSLLLLGLFATLALVLSVVGIYGITAYSVAQRTRELGLRMALGAQPGGLLGMVVRETGVLAALGVGLGLVAAYWLTRLMASLLFNVEATDPVIFASVSLGLVLVAVIAALLPGRRATRIEPLTALRAE